MAGNKRNGNREGFNVGNRRRLILVAALGVLVGASAVALLEAAVLHTTSSNQGIQGGISNLISSATFWAAVAALAALVAALMPLMSLGKPKASEYTYEAELNHMPWAGRSQGAQSDDASANFKFWLESQRAQQASGQDPGVPPMTTRQLFSLWLELGGHHSIHSDYYALLVTGAALARNGYRVDPPLTRDEFN
jgi:hypothetical protein